jgi:hypothetical protein
MGDGCDPKGDVGEGEAKADFPVYPTRQDDAIIFPDARDADGK